MAVNKVVYGTTVLVDLTEDTVAPDKLAKGITAHDKVGNLITGTMESGGSASEYSIWERCTIGEVSDTYALSWDNPVTTSLGNFDYTGTHNLKLFSTYTFDEKTGEITLTGAYSSSKVDKPTQIANYANYPYYYEDRQDGETNATVYKITDMTQSGSGFMATYKRSAAKALVVAGESRPGKGDVIELVASITPTTYPTDGQQGEYWYVQVQ